MRARRAGASTLNLRVEVAPNGTDVARAGLVVPRAVGGAVVRNRMRRRLREVLRPRLAELAGLDVVVIAGPQASGMAHAALVEDVDVLLRGARARLGGGRGRPVRAEKGDNGRPGVAAGRSARTAPA